MSIIDCYLQNFKNHYYRETCLTQYAENILVSLKVLYGTLRLRCLNKKKTQFLLYKNNFKLMYVTIFIVYLLIITLHDITDTKGSHCRDI